MPKRGAKFRVGSLSSSVFATAGIPGIGFREARVCTKPALVAPPAGGGWYSRVSKLPLRPSLSTA